MEEEETGEGEFIRRREGRRFVRRGTPERVVVVTGFAAGGGQGVYEPYEM